MTTVHAVKFEPIATPPFVITEVLVIEACEGHTANGTLGWFSREFLEEWINEIADEETKSDLLGWVASLPWEGKGSIALYFEEV